MAHAHHHPGESSREYFTEQLLTLFVVGMFGFVAVQLYRYDMLKHILAPAFRLPVLIGGVAVLLLVAVRAVAVWREAGQVGAAVAHHHDHAHHVHGPDCDHDHGHHDHDHHDHPHADHGEDDHGHSHDLSWVFARMMVLFFPVALFFIGVPNAGFSKERIDLLLGADEALNVTLGKVNYGDGIAMSFNDLKDAAYDPDKREYFGGKVGILEGKFRPLGQNQFTLYRLKMTCCAADTIPLKVRIVTPTALGGFNDGDWVQAKGEVRFLPDPKTGQFIPVIAVADVADVKKTPAKNEYE